MAAAPAGTQTPPQYTVDDLAMMPYDQRAAVLATQPPSTVDAWHRYQHTANAHYLAKSLRKEAQCVMANGGATAQNWAAGKTLFFNIPEEDFAYLETVRIWFALQVSPTAGTGTAATYAMNYCGPLGLVDDLRITLGNAQIEIPLFVLADYARLQRRFAGSLPRKPVAGYVDATLDTWRGTETFPIAVGAANNWNFYIDVPLKLIHRLDPRGMLPIYSSGIPCQVAIHCNGSVMGPDPLNNVLNNTNSGTAVGNAVNVTGTVSVDAIYRDGIALDDRDRLPLYLAGMGVMQFMKDQDLPQLVANKRQTARLLTASPAHYWVLAYVVDGLQSTVCSLDSNVAEFLIATNSTGTNPLVEFGPDSNVSPLSYKEYLSELLGNDLPDGVWPTVAAPIMNMVNPDDHTGVAVLDNTTSGYSSIYHGFKVNAVGNGANGINPRVEFYTAFLNPAGLQIAGLS